jgi:hypothetical protein
MEERQIGLDFNILGTHFTRDKAFMAMKIQAVVFLVFTLKMEAAWSSKSLLSCITTWCHNPEDPDLHIYFIF